MKTENEMRAWRTLARRSLGGVVVVVLALGFGATILPARGLTADDAAAGLNLARHRGKVVIVDFWASWCVPCRRSFPWLNAMQDRYAEDGLVIIGVNVDKDAADAEAFLAEYPAQFRIVYDPEGNLARQFDVVAMPSSFVIGRDGEIAETHLGFKVKKQDDYEASLLQLL